MAVETPEGVRLTFHVAPLSDRLAALLVDLLVLTGFLTVVVVVLLLARPGLTFVLIVMHLAFFFARFVYFTASELKSRGATFGKRRTRIRVVDARGGVLTTEAVVVRNVLRELEFFVPLVVLATAGTTLGDHAGVARIASGMWALCFAAVPIIHPRRLRIGDLFAGTMVVVMPEAVLLADVGRERAPARGRATGDSGDAVAVVPTFSEAHLDVYGEYELHVLEDVMRRGREGRRGHEAFAAVCDRIVRKIDWPDPVAPPDAEAFLRAYYAALRARLEQLRVLGRSRADQHDRGGKRP